MKKNISRSRWAISLFLVIISCSRYPIDELLSAPERVEINNREYILEAFLTRDFMPPMPPSGLFGVVYVIALDSLEFPSSLDASHVWVIYGSNVWETDLIERTIPIDKIYKMKKKLAEEGPDWGPDIYVTVVVEIVQSEEDSCLLRADSQYVLRTE